MEARNETLAETAKRLVALPPAGVVWTFILGSLAAFLGWIAVSVNSIREAQIETNGRLDRIEEGQERLERGQDETRSILMRGSSDRPAEDDDREISAVSISTCDMPSRV